MNVPVDEEKPCGVCAASCRVSQPSEIYTHEEMSDRFIIEYLALVDDDDDDVPLTRRCQEALTPRFVPVGQPDKLLHTVLPRHAKKYVYTHFNI